jgi:hypothetical protein
MRGILVAIGITATAVEPDAERRMAMPHAKRSSVQAIQMHKN